MQFTYLPADPVEALLMRLHNIVCSLSSGGPCMMPM